MNENLLQYLWKYKIFSKFDFKDTDENPIEILDFGTLNTNSGPDFSLAKIKTKNIVLAGNIEIHVKSSDWYFHNHDLQKDYQSVILHIVYFNDTDVSELKEAGIPTLELKDYINKGILAKYQTLENQYQFIPCESIFDASKVPFLFSEETLLKKLDEKSIEIDQLLNQSKNNYEAVLFQKLAYSFGLKVNAEIYQNIAENIDFKIIQKISQNQFQLESLLFGKGNILEKETETNQKWKREFEFLKIKFKISEQTFPVKFMRLMPPSFPTIRLSQLATLYHLQPNLFSKILKAKNIQELKSLFEKVKTSDFWENHYTFEKTSEEKIEKKLSDDFIEILLINAVLPIIYTYFKNINPEKTDQVLEFYKNLSPEKNSIISSWKKLNVKFSSALETQAFLYHHKHLCSYKNCLNCNIGLKILKD
ncbi:DUF2851 family protein [Cloacibacterium sp.]|uniref:DUF2851 family protein n=1 Tax=Cloacibacterium sp. TaxID=1913682 RepID=UPI00352F77A8